jgi:hypothetical protein
LKRKKSFTIILGWTENPLRLLKDRGFLILLFLIVITGSFFRFWGISSVYQRVDDIPVAKQIETIYNGYWKPDPVFYYPIFFDYIVAISLRCLSGILGFLGVHKDAGLFKFSFDQILFAARVISALLGSLTIVLVYAIGKKLYSVKEDLLASFLFSVSFIHILYSHQIVLDVPMTFFYALALYFCALLLEKRRRRDYFLAGFAGGLAIATKYNGIFILFSIFLAHLLSAPPIKRKIWKALLDFKLYLAGLSAVLGFFIAHPYALLHFKRFLGASSLLIKTVHETEYYLKPIQPKTAVDFILYNKYFLGLKNILIAEGPIFLILIFLGIICVFVHRNKQNIFLSLSGLFYFLGTLGFLGFSRFRDIPPLAISYSFLGMLGVGLARDLLKNPKAAKITFSALIVLAFISLEFSAWAKTYYLWEDDTTEVAERWIKRNIPEGSSFGKEWFSPPTGGESFRYPTFSAAFLFSRDFAPYERFDFIITSSAAYGHFFRNQKFYPEIIGIYRNVREKNELIKNFYFKDIEYKNPELNIFSTKSRNKIKQRMSLPSVLPLNNPAREFEVIDGSPYGKNINSFFLGSNQEAKRIFISRKKIPQIAFFVSAAESDGEVVLKNFPLEKKLKIKKGVPEVFLFRPNVSFPFYRYIYKISIQSGGGLKSVFVKLCSDEFDIALEFFRLGNYQAAKEFFLKALGTRPKNALDLEIYFYLAYCSKRLGLDREIQRYLKEASMSSFWRRYARLYSPSEEEETWRRSFEKFSGLNYPLFEELLTNFVDDAEFEFQNAKVVESPQFFKSKALLPASDETADALQAVSPEKRLFPQKYRLELEFYNPSKIEGPVGELEIILREDAMEDRQFFPIVLTPMPESDFSSASSCFDVDSFMKRIQFVIKIDKDKNVAFDYLKIRPDIKDFFDKKKTLFQEFTEGNNLSSSDAIR